MSRNQKSTSKTVEEVISRRLVKSPFQPNQTADSSAWKPKARAAAKSRLSKTQAISADDEEIIRELSKLTRAESASAIPFDSFRNFYQSEFDGTRGFHRSDQMIRATSASATMSSKAMVPFQQTITAQEFPPARTVNRSNKWNHTMGSINMKELSFQQEQQLKQLKSQCIEITKRLKGIEKLTTQIKDSKMQELVLPRRVQRSFHAVQNKLYALGRTFLTGDDKTRDTAATNISRCIRGWLARKKYKRALNSLHEWRNQETISLRSHVLNWISNQESISKKIEFVRHQHFQRLANIAFIEWKAITKGNITSNLQLHKKEEQIQIRRWNNLLRKILLRWRDAAYGPHSRKKISQSYKMRYDEAYHQVALRNLRDDPDPKEIHKEFRRITLAFFTQSKNRKYLMSWYKFVFNSEENQKIMLEKALSHYMSNLSMRYFRRWKLWIRDMRSILKSPRSILPPERLKITNPSSSRELNLNDEQEEVTDERRARRRNKIATIYREHWELQRRIFKSWRRRVIIRNEVNRLLKKRHLQMKSRIFAEWMSVCREQRKVKLEVLQRWVGVSLSRLELAFKAWYVWYARKRAERTSKRFLVEAFIRRRNMRLVSYCFKGWVRAVQLSIAEPAWIQDEVPDLSRRYEEQLYTNSLLKKNVESYRRLLENFENTLKTQEEHFKKKEGTISEKDNDLLSSKFALHNAQMEVQRLKMIMEKSLLKYVAPVKSMAVSETPLPSKPTTPAQTPSMRAQTMSQLGQTGSTLMVPSQNFGVRSPSDTNLSIKQEEAEIEEAPQIPTGPRRVVGKNALCIVPTETADDDQEGIVWRDSTPSQEDEAKPMTDPKPRKAVKSLSILNKVAQSSSMKKDTLPPVMPSTKPLSDSIQKALARSLFDTGFEGRKINTDFQATQHTTTEQLSERPSSRLTKRPTSSRSDETDDSRRMQLHDSDASEKLANASESTDMTSSLRALPPAATLEPIPPTAVSSSLPTFAPFSTPLPAIPSTPFSQSHGSVLSRSHSLLHSQMGTPMRTSEVKEKEDTGIHQRPVESMDLLERAKFVQQALDFLQIDPNSPSPQLISLMNFLRSGSINSDVKDIEKKIKQQNQTQELMKRLHRTSQTVTWGDILGFVDTNGGKKK